VIVELHEDFRPVRDLTGACGALSFTHSVSGSLSASATFYFPIREWGGGPPVRPGSWLVIRDATTRKAHWWGYVRNVSSGRSVGGKTPHGVATVPVQVSADSFTALLTDARMLLAPALKLSVPGAVYQFESWGPAMKAWMGAMKASDPGELLATVFRELAKQSLPDSLGGEAIGDAVGVAWSRAHAPLALKGRWYDVPGVAMQAFGNVIPSGTIWSAIQGTFGADPTMVELFPGVYDGKPTTRLGAALGVRARLIYRMAPLHPSRGVSGPGAVASGLFQIPPSPGDFTPILADDVLNWSVSWSDSKRQNGWWAETYLQPKSQMGIYGLLGTPIIQSADARRHGLRLYDARWPFFPSSDGEAPKATIISAIDALIEYAAHVTQDGHLRGDGSLSLRPNPSLRPGVWATVDLGAGVPWTCYLTAVSHSAQVDEDSGLRVDTTRADYTRGFFGTVEPATPVREPGAGGPADVDLDLSVLGVA